MLSAIFDISILSHHIIQKNPQNTYGTRDHARSVVFLWEVISPSYERQPNLIITVPADDLTLNSHYSDVIMSMVASQITSLTIVYSTVYSCADQRKHQSSASLAFVRGIHRWPVNSPHKGPVTRKMFPFDDVIMTRSSADTIAITILQNYPWFLNKLCFFLLFWT